MRGRGRRILVGLLACFAALLSASPASAVSLDGGGGFTVDVRENGGLGVQLGDSQELYGNGLSLYFTSGALTERAWSSWGYGHDWYSPVRQDPVTTIGGILTQETVYAVRVGETEHARVLQTVRVRPGDTAARVTYRVVNTGAERLGFRAVAAGETVRSGLGAYRTGGRRFVAVLGSGTGRESGLEQVLESRLAGDSAPVAVPAWSAYRAGDYYDVLSGPAWSRGIGNGADRFAGAVGAEWTDRTSTGLAPGATARYEVLWRFGVVPPLSLAAGHTYRYVGASTTVTATTGDADGRAAAGQLVRWRVSGATFTGERTVTTGADGTVRLTYTGEAPGDATVDAYVDRDRDAVRDPDEPAAQAIPTNWETPPPRVAVQEYDLWGQVGTWRQLWVALRDRLGEPIEGDVLRWTMEGANATAEPQVVHTGASGEGTIQMRPRHAGEDVLVVWADEDGDGVRDAEEPSVTRTLHADPPPPQLELQGSGVYQAGEQRTVWARTVDEFGVPRAQTAVRWSISGVTSLGPQTATTDEYGWASFSYTAPRGGTDHVTAYVDLDGDAARDADEPEHAIDVRWAMAPPPPVTGVDLRADPLEITARSNSALAVTRHEGPAVRAQLACSWCPLLVLRFSGGPLAGHAFGGSYGEPFYGDAQTAAVRTGDTVAQTTTYRVRWDDVDHVRVHQTTTMRDGRSDVRVRYRLENLTGEPFTVRVGTAAGLYVGGRSYGNVIRTTAATRFVGGYEPSTGTSSGLREVAGSPWERSDAGYASSMLSALEREAGLDGEIPTWDTDFGAAAQWAPATVDAGASRSYEVDWVFDEPGELHVTPFSDEAETWHEHQVTATLVDADRLPRVDVPLRWETSGANRRSGTVTTSGTGQAVIAWTGREPGQDRLTVYADLDGDEVLDDAEPSRTATVDWRAETAVDAPVLDPLLTPSGAALTVYNSGSFIGLTPSQAAQFPTCSDGSAKVRLRLHVNVDPGAGWVVDGSMSLRLVDPVTGNLESPVESIAPVGEAVEDTYSFVVECLRPTVMYLCYTLEEAGIPAERFCVLLSALGLYDPSGTVYDKAEYDERIEAGDSPAEARAATAVGGAEVRLQRRVDGGWRQMLSGNPFMTPNVNPYPTLEDGRFGWHVPEGTYRVVVRADGYQPATSRAVTVPPAVMDLDVGLVREGAEPAPEPEPETTPEATPEPTVAPTPEPTAEPTPDATPDAPEQSVDDGWTPYAPLPEAEAQYAPPPPAAPAIPPRAAPSPPAAKPAATVTRTQLDRRGRLKLTLACPAGAAPCAGSYRLLAAKRSIGSLRYSVAAGKRAKRTVKLTNRSRKALKAAQGRVKLVPSAGAVVTIVVR